MTQRKNNALLVDIALMYYLDNETQEEIAERLYISRSQVSKLLKEAREQRIVTFNIKSSEATPALLSNKLKQKYGVSELYVIEDEESIKKTEYKINEKIVEILTEYNEMAWWGLTGGPSTVKLKKFIVPMQLKVNTVKLFGTVNNPTYKRESLKKMSYLIGSKYHDINIPMHVQDNFEFDRILNSTEIENYLEKLQKIEFIIADADFTNKKGLFSSFPDDEERAVGQEYCGSIGNILFDRKGEIVNSKFNYNNIGISKKQFKNTKKLVLIDSQEDVNNVRSLLKTGLVDILVISKSMAYELADASLSREIHVTS